MSFNDYKVYCFKDVDYIATKVKDINQIIEFYRLMFEDDLDISEVKEIKDRDKEFILINEETHFKEKTTYKEVLNRFIFILS